MNSIDSEFDRYRKNRIRFRNKELPSGGSGYDNSALRELERVEELEVRDQQLTREVHEFFATATQQAAGIVERMAHDVEAEADVRIAQEMEAFLIDAFARMNGLVRALIQKKHGNAAETRLEPKVANLVGQLLDEFRWEGTADLIDKHIGQDPFATDLDSVRRELQTQVGQSGTATVDASATAPIEEHLVAAIDDAEGADALMARLATAVAGQQGAPVDERDSPDPAVAEPVAPVQETTSGSGEVAEPPAASGPTPAVAVESAPETSEHESAPRARAAARAPGGPSRADELERFKAALKSLVRQGTMTRDEARAAWVTRLKALGIGSM